MASTKEGNDGTEAASNYEMMASRRATPNSGGHSLQQAEPLQNGRDRNGPDTFSTICRHFQYNTDTTSTICRHNTIWFLYTILKYIQQIVETSFSIQHTIHNINTTSIIRSGHKWENWCRRWQRNTSNWYKLHTVTDNHKWLTPDWDHRRRPTTKWSKMLHTSRQQPTSAEHTTQ